MAGVEALGAVVPEYLERRVLLDAHLHVPKDDARLVCLVGVGLGCWLRVDGWKARGRRRVGRGRRGQACGPTNLTNKLLRTSHLCSRADRSSKNRWKISTFFGVSVRALSGGVYIVRDGLEGTTGAAAAVDALDRIGWYALTRRSRSARCRCP